MSTDPQQLKRVDELQHALEELLGFDVDSEISITEDGLDESFALVLTEEAAARIVERLRAAKARKS